MFTIIILSGVLMLLSGLIAAFDDSETAAAICLLMFVAVTALYVIYLCDRDLQSGAFQTASVLNILRY